MLFMVPKRLPTLAFFFLVWNFGNFYFELTAGISKGLKDEICPMLPTSILYVYSLALASKLGVANSVWSFQALAEEPLSWLMRADA